MMKAASFPACQRHVVSQGYDGATCWVNPWAGASPDGTAAVMTVQRLDLSGSDVFFGACAAYSRDRGHTWSSFEPVDSMGRMRDAGSRLETCINDLKPAWHAKSGCLLGIGVQVYYRPGAVKPNHIEPGGRGAQTVYSTCDPTSRRWTAPRLLVMPDDPRFEHAVAGSVQRCDLPNGDILLPVYFHRLGDKTYSSVVAQCTFDGETLAVSQLGNSLTVNTPRGLYEPSVVYHRGHYLLTLRQDHAGYVAASEDGLHYNRPRAWCFDDGQLLGNYNTQQHWVVIGDDLYLVYNRRGLANDHVFRHRAPLVMAQVDPDRLCVLRETEVVLVPERGARLGNFGITPMPRGEAWVTVAEWMQPRGCEKHGSDNSIYLVRLNR